MYIYFSKVRLEMWNYKNVGIIIGYGGHIITTICGYTVCCINFTKHSHSSFPIKTFYIINRIQQIVHFSFSFLIHSSYLIITGIIIVKIKTKESEMNNQKCFFHEPQNTLIKV